MRRLEEAGVARQGLHRMLHFIPANYKISRSNCSFPPSNICSWEGGRAGKVGHSAVQPFLNVQKDNRGIKSIIS